MTEWKDKRLAAINRRIKNNPRNARYLHDYYLDEYTSLCSSEARNKREYKLEKGMKTNERLH